MEILYGAFVFILVISFLIILLNEAGKRLIPQGDAKIIINEDQNNSLKVSRGATLLSTLMNNKITLPSACGGGGTCAMCRCQINSGGGDVLATEKNHLSLKEQKEGWRLACQVKVRNDMEIKVPPEIFSIKSWD